MSNPNPENENLNPDAVEETPAVDAVAEEEPVQEESLESRLAAAEQKAAEMQDLDYKMYMKIRRRDGVDNEGK